MDHNTASPRELSSNSAAKAASVLVACRLRAVHSTFQQLLDPRLFAQCDVNNSGDTYNHLIDLLCSPRIGKQVKVPQVIRSIRMLYSADFDGMMRSPLKNVRKLYIDESVGQNGFWPCNLALHIFLGLRHLSVFDTAACLYIPYIVQAAPHTETLEMGTLSETIADMWEAQTNGNADFVQLDGLLKA